MSSRKEQKEALRQERQQREEAAQKAAARKRMVGIVVAAVLVLGIVGALAVVLTSGGDDDGGGGGGGGGEGAKVDYPDGGTIPDQEQADLKLAMESAGCEEETVESNGAPDHTTDINEKIDYSSEPPSIGRHFQEFLDDDIFEEAPNTIQIVHSLEHGRILIWVRPDLTEEQLGQFKALYEEDPYHVIMLPREELKEPFGVTAWTDGSPALGHILRCKELNDSSWDAIRAFKTKYRDKGPEFVP